MSFLDRLTGRDVELEQLLAAYPIVTWPHAGMGTDLSAEQRDENLDWLVSVKADRIEVLTVFLSRLGLRLPSPGAPGLNPQTVSAGLDELAKRRFIRMPDFEASCAFGWRRRAANGREATTRSVAIDLGIYLGECATHASEPFEWRIGESRYRPANMPMTAGEVVISKVSTLGPKPMRVDLDVIDWSVFAVWDIVRRRKQKSFWKPNHFEFLIPLLANRY